MPDTTDTTTATTTDQHPGVSILLDLRVALKRRFDQWTMEMSDRPGTWTEGKRREDAVRHILARVPPDLALEAETVYREHSPPDGFFVGSGQCRCWDCFTRSPNPCPHKKAST